MKNTKIALTACALCLTAGHASAADLRPGPCAWAPPTWASARKPT